MLPITTHAKVRLQQRGIPPVVVESLLDFGRQAYDHRGGAVLFFDQKARAKLRQEIANNYYKQIESHLDAYVVLGPDGEIVTVGHRKHRINRH